MIMSLYLIPVFACVPCAVSFKVTCVKVHVCSLVCFWIHQNIILDFSPCCAPLLPHSVTHTTQMYFILFKITYTFTWINE